MSDVDFANPTETPPNVIDPAVIREAKRGMRVDIAQTGFNPALGRLPAIETQTVSLNTVLDFVPSWTARRIPIKCIGSRGILDFPDEINFSMNTLCPVKYLNSKVLLIRNIGNRDAKFSFKVEK